MLTKTDLINEIQVRINNLLWSVVAQYTYQKGNDSLCDECIRVSSEDKFTIYVVTLQPYTALTTIKGSPASGEVYFSVSGFLRKGS